MNALQITLLIAALLLLSAVGFHSWISRCWFKNIITTKYLLNLPETDELNLKIEKVLGRAELYQAITQVISPFTSQIKYLFTPIVIAFGLSFLF